LLLLLPQAVSLAQLFFARNFEFAQSVISASSSTMTDEDEDVVMKAAPPLPTKVQVICEQLRNGVMIFVSHRAVGATCWRAYSASLI
jgi:hypothetical protein